jgi:hypothetical protein
MDFINRQLISTRQDHNKSRYRFSMRKGILGALLLSLNLSASPSYAADSETASLCPPFGWSEGLNVYLKQNTSMPIDQTSDDCSFHMWSWEAFIWATALDNGVPRFMSLATPDQLFASNDNKAKKGMLRLSTRAISAHSDSTSNSTSNSASNKPEGAGAIVEADGNMLVGKNGYPVYASVHMNSAYFNTVKQNMIVNGGYQNPPAAPNDYFTVGAGVIKATWLRLDDGEKPPLGAFTTQAEVPVLTVDTANSQVVTSGDVIEVTVALVGLHVVGLTPDHPEFLWATFEHNLNAPMLDDNTFCDNLAEPGCLKVSDPNNYTFYQSNTQYDNVNLQNQEVTYKAALSFGQSSQKFSPATNVVQKNKTGGENHSPNGPANITNLNESAQGFLKALSAKTPNPQSVFSHYNLIGTVWMQPNTYVKTTTNWQGLNQANAVGSVNLANSTAETFQQQAHNNTAPIKPIAADKLGNCFECHNPQSFTYQTPPGKTALQARLVAISHVTAEGSATYAVPNSITLKSWCINKPTASIVDNQAAQTVCPTVCKATSTEKVWRGEWTNTADGSGAVCGCCNN